MIRAVLFDFHNTLVTCDEWLELEISTLPALALDLVRSYGYLRNSPPHDHARLRERFHLVRKGARESGVEISAVEGTRIVFEDLGYKVPLSAITEAVAELEKHCLTTVSPIEGGLETVERLHRSGLKLGIVSSAGWPDFVEMALVQEGLRPYFTEVLTSAGEGIYKSDPEIFLRACRRLGVEPSSTVHIGDHAVYDVQTARAAGLRTIWFNAHARRTAQLHNADWDELERQGSHADGTVSSLAEIPLVLSDRLA